MVEVEEETDEPAGEEESSPPQPSWALNIGLMVVSTLIALVLAEVIFYNAVSYQYLRIRYYRLGEIFQANPENVRFDADLGFLARPKLDTRLTTEEFDTAIKTNSMGFRDNEASLYSPEYLMFGDSFIFGWGVEEEEALPSVFEEVVDATVLNLGQSGYGNLQELLLFERLLPEVQAENPKAIVLVYDNDPADNCSPMYTLFPTVRKASEEYVVTKPVETAFREAMELQEPTVGKWISRKSLIADFLISRLNPPEPNVFYGGSPEALAGYEVSGDPVGEEEAFRYCMNRFTQKCEEEGVELHVVYIPPLSMYQGEGDSQYPLVGSVLKDLEIPHLDLTPILDEEDYLAIDGHWNPGGHRRAALAIVDHLIREGSLTPILLERMKDRRED